MLLIRGSAMIPESRRRFVMRLALSLFVLILAAGFAVSLVRREAATNLDGWSQTEIQGIMVRRSSIDLGVASVRAMQQGSFEFLNTGRAPARIARAIPQCGCTVVSPPQELANHGQQITLPVSVNYSMVGLGTFQKAVAVEFESAEGTSLGKIVLSVNGRADQLDNIVIYPGTIDFGEIRPGDSISRTLYAFGDSAAINALPSVFNVPFDGRATALHTTLRAPAGHLIERAITAQLSVPAGAPVGPYRGSIELLCDDIQMQRLNARALVLPQDASGEGVSRNAPETPIRIGGF